MSDLSVATCGASYSSPATNAHVAHIRLSNYLLKGEKLVDRLKEAIPLMIE